MNSGFYFKHAQIITAKYLLCAACGLLMALTFFGMNVQSVYAQSKQYNVVSFGADPTGKQDSTKAILGAIAAAKSAGGGTVFFPNGTFLYNKAITFPNGVSAAGESYLTTIVQPTNEESCSFVFVGTNSISNLNVDPQHIAYGPGSPALRADIYANGQESPSSLTINNVNSGQVRCIGASLTISNAPTIAVNSIVVTACPYFKMNGGTTTDITIGPSFKKVPSRSVSIEGVKFIGNVASINLATKDVKTLTIQNCEFDNGGAVIRGGSNCFFANNSFQNTKNSLGLDINGVTGNALSDENGLHYGVIVSSNQFAYAFASISGCRESTGEDANGNILFTNNTLEQGQACFGGEDYTNNCKIIHNTLSNGATLRLTPGYLTAAGVLGGTVLVQNNKFLGTYKLQPNRDDAWLISVDSAQSVEHQKRDPLPGGVNIVGNYCNVNVPPVGDSQLGFIACCTPDPSTPVDIKANTQAPGSFLQTVQNHDIRAVPGFD